MGRLEEKILEYRQVMDTGPEGLDERYQGILYGLEISREITSGELDRLRKIEAKAKELLAGKEQDLVDVREDMAECVENDWDEGHERLSGRENRVLSQIKLLRGLLNA